MPLVCKTLHMLALTSLSRLIFPYAFSHSLCSRHNAYFNFLVFGTLCTGLCRCCCLCLETLVSSLLLTFQIDLPPPTLPSAAGVGQGDTSSLPGMAGRQRRPGMAWTESLCRGEGFAERHRQDVIHRFRTIPSNLNPIQPSLP